LTGHGFQRLAIGSGWLHYQNEIPEFRSGPKHFISTFEFLFTTFNSFPMSRKHLGIITMALLIQGGLSAQVLSQWRGEDRRGIYPGDGNLSSWPTGGPQLLWANDSVGDGYASPVCYDGKIYLCGVLDSTASLFILNTSGKIERKIAYGREWMKNYIGSRNAPTLTAEAIYLSTGLGSLVCLDRETLKVKWQVEGSSGFHNQLSLFGHAESPAVDGDRVFFVPGGRDTNVVALDRFTGNILWVCKGDGERPGYNSPLIIKLPNRTLLVTFSAYSLMGIDAKTGQLLWTHPQDNLPVSEHKPGYGDTHSNTVWYDNGALYYVAGDGNGAVRLILAPDGNSIRQVWRNQAVDNFMGGFIKQGNTIYSCSDSKKALCAIDITTGQATDTLKCGTGTIVSDGQLLYYYNQRGEMNLVRPGAGKLELAGKFKVTQGTKEHFSHPVIDRGVLYLRHGRSLLAWKIKP